MKYLPSIFLVLAGACAAMAILIFNDENVVLIDKIQFITSYLFYAAILLALYIATTACCIYIGKNMEKNEKQEEQKDITEFI